MKNENERQTNITVSLPRALKIRVLRRTYELDIDMSKYVRHLIRADLKKSEEWKNEQAGQSAQTDSTGEAY